MKIGILGHGVVGSGVSKIIESNNYEDIQICSILVKNESEILDDRFTLNIDDILNNKEIDTVIECMGGDEPAHSFVRKALENGKNVISANKKMLANHLDLFDIANKNNVKLLIEASSGGGIPWLINLRRIKRSDEISEIKGIINGTTNYLLSRLFNEDIDFDEVLKDAQKLGYAEKDPTDDIKGYDVKYKLCLSSYEAFDLLIDHNSIPTYGIDTINKQDINYAKENGYVIKLIASASYKGNKLQAIVMPRFIKKDDIFASVNSNFNIVMSNSNYLGKAYFIGQGAGSLPTGQAIVQDVLDLKDNNYLNEKRDIRRIDNDINIESKYYIRGNIDKLGKYIDKKINDNTIITKKCLYSDIKDLIDENMFIGEIDDD